MIIFDNLHFPCPRRSPGWGFNFLWVLGTKMPKFKVVIAYDGTDFFGWQKQTNVITVSSAIEKAFYHVFGQNISLIGSSRTDGGVHALGQVAVFRCDDLNIPNNIIQSAWNARLPGSIFIRELSEVDDDFHPCFNVLQKTYYYHLFLQRPLPFVARYGWQYKFINKIDLDQFYKTLQLYVGEHDFASFCKIEEEGKSTIRRIDSIEVEKLARFGAVRIIIKGPGFLHFQIRRMIGYALDVVRRPDLSINYLQGLLDNPDPKQILTKAEGCGLCLRKVVYK